MSAATNVPSDVICPDGFFYTADGTCVPKFSFVGNNSNNSGGLTTAQAMGIGVVIGAFVMTFILIGGFFLLRRTGGTNRRKNAVIMVTENGKDSRDEEKMELR